MSNAKGDNFEKNQERAKFNLFLKKNNFGSFTSDVTASREGGQGFVTTFYKP
jgi:hypothetical protein